LDGICFDWWIQEGSWFEKECRRVGKVHQIFNRNANKGKHKDDAERVVHAVNEVVSVETLRGQEDIEARNALAGKSETTEIQVNQDVDTVSISVTDTHSEKKNESTSRNRNRKISKSMSEITVNHFNDKGSCPTDVSAPKKDPFRLLKLV
jgi:hypothetical protein